MQQKPIVIIIATGAIALLMIAAIAHRLIKPERAVSENRSHIITLGELHQPPVGGTMKRICIIWLVLMSLTWIVCQFIRVSGRCVVGNQTVCFAFDHGGLWFLHVGTYEGPTTLQVDTNAFLSNGATLAPPILQGDMLYQLGVIPYWLVAVPGALGLWWQRHKRIRRPPRGFAVQ